MEKEIISWDEYFLGLAVLSAKRSKDPNTQVGACIVDKNNNVLSLGYNGFPRGCSDQEFPWGKQGGVLETKYAYVVHAEANAIMNAKGQDLKDAIIYVTLFPCNECAKLIIQAGIKTVYYVSDKYDYLDSTKASKRMLEAAGVHFQQLNLERKHLDLDW